MRGRPADRAWLALAAGVVVWDAGCKSDEMLSDASRRYTVAQPVVWRFVVLYTAGHLIHLWSPKWDGFTWLAKLFGR